MRSALCVAAIVTASGVGRADDPPGAADKAAQELKARLRERVGGYLEAGTTGAMPERPDDLAGGRLVRKYFVVRAVLKASLGDDEAGLFAEEQAADKAKEEFVKFVNGSKFTVKKDGAREVLVVAEGEATADGAATTETSKTVERTTKVTTETAGGLVKGLRPVGKVQKGRTLTAVYVWEPAADTARHKPAAGPAGPESKPVIID